MAFFRYNASFHFNVRSQIRKKRVNVVETLTLSPAERTGVKTLLPESKLRSIVLPKLRVAACAWRGRHFALRAYQTAGILFIDQDADAKRQPLVADWIFKITP